MISCNFVFHHLLFFFFSPTIKQIPKTNIVCLLALQIKIILLPLSPFLAFPSHTFHQLDLLWRSHMHTAKVSESPLLFSIKMFARIYK